MKPAYIVAIISVLLLGTFLFLIRDLYLPGDENATIPPEPERSPFEQCVAETGVVMESYPRQCRWRNGSVVHEVLSEPGESAPAESETSIPEPSEEEKLADPYFCNTHADCVVKNVGNCCGYYPACVNKDHQPDPEALQAECEKSGVASVCGFREITSCSCIDNRCEG